MRVHRACLFAAAALGAVVLDDLHFFRYLDIAVYEYFFGIEGLGRQSGQLGQLQFELYEFLLELAILGYFIRRRIDDDAAVDRIQDYRIAVFNH